MEHQVEGRDACINSSSPAPDTVTQSSIEGDILSSSSTLGSFTTLQLDHEDEGTLLSLSASQHSTIEHQLEGREPNPGAASNPPHVEDESARRSFSGQMHSDTEHHHKHRRSSFSTSGKIGPVIQHSVRVHFTSNTFAQQVKIQQQRPFLLSDPAKSSIMLHRNHHAESTSAGSSSISKETLHNVNPKRVSQLISTLGFDDQMSEMFHELVLATAPFYDTDPPSTQPAPETSSPKADAVREALDTLTFEPKSASSSVSPSATAPDDGSLVGDSSENPTANFLFDAKAAENLESHPLEAGSNSPPLLWSTAAAEESLDPNADDPTYFTVDGFVNTIVENKIQVDSVTDEDWMIEEMRVAILERLKDDISEDDLTDEEDSDEADVIDDEATEEVKAGEIKVEEIKAEKVNAKEDTPESNLQRWEEQGPEGWLKKEDGTDMNEEEIDEECARWDAMVREAENEKEAGKVSGCYTPSVYSDDGKNTISTAKGSTKMR